MVVSWILDFDMRVFCLSRVYVLLSVAVWSRGGLSRASIPTATLADVDGICFSDGYFVV